MPDFLQIGQPSSTASSLEIGSTLLPDQVDWGTDLLSQRYVQTVQAEGGILAVEQAPNRKITLPFIYKGTSPDDANQFLQKLQSVVLPGNVVDVRPEGASWITRFDIEGARVIAHRDIRYHRQSIMQGTVELSTRPWGYTPTWMIAASVTAQKPFQPFAASVIGDLPAHSRWNFIFKPAAAAVTSVGGLIIGQHQMPSYRTVWGAQTGGAALASLGFETLAANPSVPAISNSQWAASAFVNDVKFAQMNVAAEPEIQNLASSTRAFVHAYWSQASTTGGFSLQLMNGGRALSRPAFMVKTSGFGTAPTEGQLIDFGEINRQLIMTPDGVATQIRLQMHPIYDTTVASVAGNQLYVDAIVLIPNANIFALTNPLSPGGVPGDVWGQGAVSSTYQVNIDSKLQRMWRTVNGGTAMANELTPFARGAWPLLLPAGPSGPANGLVVGVLGADAIDLVGTPYAQASGTFQAQVIYQPRWLLFR